MPTYRNITIKLVSHFDILTIPEYAPPATLNDPFSIPPYLVNAEKSLVSVYVSTYPLSQFWLSYSISAPHPPKSFCYFKLFINGASIVSWGCGKEDGYKGKTMFSLFDSGERWMGVPGIDVRAFYFASDSETIQQTKNNALGDIMEVRVYRSKGRIRINPELESFRDLVNQSNGPSSQSLQQPAYKKTQPRNIKGGVR